MSEEKNGHELETIKDETSGALDVVTDLLSDTVIPAPIRRNAWKAFKQLCTAAIEVPVAYLEGKAAEIRTGTESRVKIIKENADQIAEQMNVPPEYARRAANKFAEKIIREQVNLDAISAVAAGELNKDESTNPTGPNTDDTAEKPISDDWLNSFDKEASQKSSEEMQFFFGRILAGEIRQPGSYSIKAVKILGNLHQSAANLFKKLCSASVVLRIPGSKEILDIRVPSLGGDAALNVLRPYGLGFSQLNILHEYGLIIADYNSWRDYRMCVVNENSQITLPFSHRERQWALLPSADWKNPDELRVSGVALSQAGCELSRIVDLDPMEKYTENLKKFFAEQKLQMVEVSSQNTI